MPKNLLEDLHADLHWDSYKPDERLRALIQRLLIKLNQSPESQFRDRIIKVEGVKTKTRNLTLTGLSTEIKNQKLVGEIQSQKSKEITPGPLSDTTKYQEDLDGTLLRAYDIINKYYSLFTKNESLKRQWGLGGAEGGYIGTNHGVQATLRVLRAILDHLEYKDKIQVKTLKTPQLISYIEKYVNPVIEYLASASTQELSHFKRSTGQSGVRDSYFELLALIRNVFPEFDANEIKRLA